MGRGLHAHAARKAIVFQLFQGQYGDSKIRLTGWPRCANFRILSHTATR